MVPGKGHKYFIEVAKELLKLNNQYQFLIVGDTFPGYEPYEEELKTVVIENKLQQKIQFLGYKREIEDVLTKTDLVFHSSIAPDSLPTVLFEAIKMRVPVAATELAGAVEILDNGNCGLLVPVNNAKKAGKSIAGYGATSKSTTILNYCGIGPELIDFISDTTPIKQNKVTPGMHIPVESYEFFKENIPDMIILFAWNHANEIIEKEKDSIDKSVEWVTHLPGFQLKI